MKKKYTREDIEFAPGAFNDLAEDISQEELDILVEELINAVLTDVNSHDYDDIGETITIDSDNELIDVTLN